MSEQFDETARPEGEAPSPAGEDAAEAAERDEAVPDGAGGAETAPDGAEQADGAEETEAEGRLAAERDEYLDSLRRLQADFDNYRKRAVRQQTELLERATEGLLVQLLPVLDALDLAEAHASEEDKTALSQVGTLLRDTLSRQGLERIDAVGVEFDPTVHDAVAHEEPDGEEDGKGHEITEVMRAGYRLKGRVVRPAMVKVKG